MVTITSTMTLLIHLDTTPPSIPLLRNLERDSLYIVQTPIKTNNNEFLNMRIWSHDLLRSAENTFNLYWKLIEWEYGILNINMGIENKYWKLNINMNIEWKYKIIEFCYKRPPIIVTVKLKMRRKISINIKWKNFQVFHCTQAFYFRYNWPNYMDVTWLEPVLLNRKLNI